jgi:hypothetical protein
MRASLTERFARQFGTDVAEGIMNAVGKIGVR